MEKHIQAGAFKAKCLSILDRVKKTRRRVIITKRGKPVAQLSPLDDEQNLHLFGKKSARAEYGF